MSRQRAIQKGGPKRVEEVKGWLMRHLKPRGDEDKEDYLSRVRGEFGSKFTSTVEKAANEIWDEEQDWKGQLKELVKGIGKAEAMRRLEVSGRTLNRWLATATRSEALEKRTPTRAHRVRIADEAADLSLRLRG